ncbi:hypothetical protein HK407_07g11600 [Ordospora pajunii]|uniref:uncharacterized protein n=1 Tax=Ordospora pajunii TaxID=3039483 RepID=UPI0029528AD4|nr:uncharacterized protein HK407_07g11600 [Ordospora pajunii]KAH9411170.1 hypothetical protein HK407_07g11600 [Ordospora pajunii]
MGFKWRLAEDLFFSCFVFLQYQIAADMKSYEKYNAVCPAIAVFYLVLKAIIILMKEFERDDEKPLTAIDFLRLAIMVSHIFIFFIAVIIINHKVSLKDIKEYGLKTLGVTPLKWVFNKMGLDENYVDFKALDKIKNEFRVDPGLMIVTQTIYMFLTAQSIIDCESSAIFIELARGVFGYITICRLKEFKGSYDEKGFFSWASPMFPTIALLSLRLVYVVIFELFIGTNSWFESIIRKKQTLLIIPAVLCTIVGCTGMLWMLKIQMLGVKETNDIENKCEGTVKQLVGDTLKKVAGEGLSYNNNGGILSKFFGKYYEINQ